ncbi:hypothetical protein TRFO_40153 [Tritrichomonas foetus]|uniref:Uncharacterized protein n=1 Tax=Tritrichomonas foetus TaxID=1144522 RepID=A0A1J4J7E9_9EUKA|nr:hypothetical protein TRFO_40153 [Tritrichomonas foetus]|eukprot:OHS93587.1 hypothetical protein TRFO_40153 [Tritrichomonas foetus]
MDFPVKKMNHTITPMPGVEYDTVRGRGDFDAGYINEYSDCNDDSYKEKCTDAFSFTHKSQSGEFRKRKSPRSSRCMASDPEDNLQREINSLPIKRNSKGRGRRNLPFISSNPSQPQEKTEKNDMSLIVTIEANQQAEGSLTNSELNSPSSFSPGAWRKPSVSFGEC